MLHSSGCVRTLQREHCTPIRCNLAIPYICGHPTLHIICWYDLSTLITLSFISIILSISIWTEKWCCALQSLTLDMLATSEDLPYKDDFSRDLLPTLGNLPALRSFTLEASRMTDRATSLPDIYRLKDLEMCPALPINNPVPNSGY